MLKKLATVSLLSFSLLATQVMAYAGEMLGQTNFDDGVGLPWHTCETVPGKTEFKITGGKYIVKIVDPGNPKQRWDCQLRHRGLKLEQNHKYTVTFTVKADKDCKIYCQIGDQGDPYYQDWNLNNRSFTPQSLTAGQAKTFTETFTATRTKDVIEMAFHIGGEDVPAGTTFEFDDISLTDPQFDPTPIPPTPTPRPVRVNQLGYFPGSAKIATYVGSSSQSWQLKTESGTTVLQGTTKAFGKDKDSGDTVQLIDFSSYTGTGTGFYIQVGNGKSFPFDIGTDMYSQLRYDSFKYFYMARSGVPIEMPYCVKDDWARPAGHVTDVAPCENPLPEGWDPYNSSHTIDMSGGWYDAGDHGKYVVNAGITMWTLQNLYERAKKYGTEAPYGDNKLNIPEKNNNIPDLLDETRFHMECMLKMQVPDGYPRAGMVHHKGHDESWTGLAVRPDQDTKDRIMKPPTTAATLNFVAVAAQSYRLWKSIDSSFANKCLSQAEIAWQAALDNPAIYAPFDDAMGGGPYGDDYVIDDFYWAACEMLAATNDSKYYDYIKSNEYFLKVPTNMDRGEEENTTSSFNWGNTHSMGTLTLALLEPSKLSSSEIKTAKDNIAKASEFYIGLESEQGYGIPLRQCTVVGGEIVGYPWGSNSFVMNNAIIMAYAYDYTKDVKHFNGAVSAMDYLFGRNPLDFVYVTGYGENPAKYPHHRFFANQVDPSFPLAPPGIAVGGPNSGLQDPWVKGSGWNPGDMPPQRCYMDHIESWSTNECTVNWNAPIAWLASYMTEVGPNVGSGTTPVTDPVGGLLGDLNLDGKVNSTDYALLRRVILEMTTISGEAKANADLNGDGKVNSTDYAALKRKILNG